MSMTQPLSCLAARVLACFLILAGPALAAPAPASSADAHARIIIKFDKSSQPASRSKAGGIPGELRGQRLGDDAVQRLGLANALKMRHQRRLGTGADLFEVDAATPLDLASVLGRLRALPGVAYAVEDRRLKINFVPNDPLFAEQWHYFDPAGGIRLPAAWELATGEGVVVAVVDTGYTDHADLLPNIIPGYDFLSDASAARDGNKRDPDAHDRGDWQFDQEVGVLYPSSWHGTHTAGTIAAVTNNGIGVAGVAFDAKILPVRVLGVGGGFISDIYDGVIWAAGGAVGRIPLNPTPAKVINMSLGGNGECEPPEQEAIDTARALGAVVVVSAGNGNYEAGTQSPANCRGVITVAATTRTGQLAPYSNVGQVVDIAAPGGDTNNSLGSGVLSTLDVGAKGPRGPGYDYYQGTSMAAPHVSGVAALMASVDPALTPDQIECTIKATARPFPRPEDCPSCGAGIVNALAAVKAVRQHETVDRCPVNPGRTRISFGLPYPGLTGERGEQLRYTVVAVPANQVITVRTRGGIGDADLYVSLDQAPSFGSADCTSYNIGNGELCVIATPETGTHKLHILVHGYREFRDVTLSADAEPILPLEPGLTEGLSGATGTYHLYRYHAPLEGGTLAVRTSGGTGDADLGVLVHDPGGELFLVCSSDAVGNEELCRVQLQGGATYDVRLYAYQRYQDLGLRARYTAPEFLEPGVPQSLSGAQGSVQSFKVQVPEGATKLAVALVPGIGDADLHLDYLDPQGPVALCQSTTTGTDRCEQLDPLPGFYEVKVSGFTDYTDFTLRMALKP